MNYILIKLVSGEELMGVSDSEYSDDFINIDTPIEISSSYDAEGNFGLKFAMFMSFSEESLFTFRARDVIVYCKPTQNMIKYYEDFLQRYKTVDEEDSFDLEPTDFKSLSIH